MADSNPSQPLGECVVCGKLCSTLCSSCKKSGLDWMYYCSEEHQKLTWKVHKLACGKNPFEWPPLSAKEVNDARRMRDAPLSLDGRSLTCTTFVTQAINNTRADRGEPPYTAEFASRIYFGKYLEYLQGNSPQTEGVEAALRLQRKLAFGSKLCENVASGEGTVLRHLSSAIAGNPLGFLAVLLGIQKDDLPEEVSRSSAFKHRLLIYFAIVTARIDNFLNGVQQLDWNEDVLLHHAQRAVLSFCYSGFSGETSTRACQAVQKIFSIVANGLSDPE
ncbi:hypothetical protein JCM5350_005631 [Sporobolomyces pararoseus]